MAVTKRLRFEVLRRDNHTCRYCGATAPDVKLTVDHVVPVALGGSDDPSNLVAACRDCNGGKSSVPADAQLVADVSADADRWSAAMRQAAEENRLHDNTEVYAAVVNAWTSFRRNQIPGDYRETIDQFLNAGLPQEDIVQMAHVADAKPSIYNRWSYFCGCCWTRVRKLQERATELVNTPNGSPTHPVSADAESLTRLNTCWSSDEMWSYASDMADHIERALGTHVSATSYDGRCDHGPDCKDMLCRLCALTTVYATVVLTRTGASNG